jgi:hypothetical protein
MGGRGQGFFGAKRVWEVSKPLSLRRPTEYVGVNGARHDPYTTATSNVINTLQQTFSQDLGLLKSRRMPANGHPQTLIVVRFAGVGIPQNTQQLKQQATNAQGVTTSGDF